MELYQSKYSSLVSALCKVLSSQHQQQQQMGKFCSSHFHSLHLSHLFSCCRNFNWICFESEMFCNLFKMLRVIEFVSRVYMTLLPLSLLDLVVFLICLFGSFFQILWNVFTIELRNHDVRIKTEVCIDKQEIKLEEAKNATRCNTRKVTEAR